MKQNTKFISVSCHSRWQNKCCDRACMLIFPDIDKELTDYMREGLKMIIEKCPAREKGLIKEKPIFN